MRLFKSLVYTIGGLMACLPITGLPSEVNFIPYSLLTLLMFGMFLFTVCLDDA